MAPKSIDELVQATLIDTNNTHWVLTFARLSKSQTIDIQAIIQTNLTGVDRLIDSSAIRHVLRRHGNSTSEMKHGQIAVTPKDFELIPKILHNPDKVEFIGENALKQKVFLYSKRIDHLYFVAESLRAKQEKFKLVFQTMYKQK